MHRIPVSSSSLRSIGYDPTTATLEVEFNTGSVYEYLGVPVNVYEGLRTAPSHGTFFNERVKAGGYAFRQVR